MKATKKLSLFDTLTAYDQLREHLEEQKRRLQDAVNRSQEELNDIALKVKNENSEHRANKTAENVRHKAALASLQSLQEKATSKLNERKTALEEALRRMNESGIHS